MDLQHHGRNVEDLAADLEGVDGSFAELAAGDDIHLTFTKPGSKGSGGRGGVVRDFVFSTTGSYLTPHRSKPETVFDGETLEAVDTPKLPEVTSKSGARVIFATPADGDGPMTQLAYNLESVDGITPFVTPMNWTG